MACPTPPPRSPPRRPRYRGKNPRHFHEKYKEHQPERYADDVAKVVAGGKTPAGTHRPIMVREVLDALAPGRGRSPWTARSATAATPANCSPPCSPAAGCSGWTPTRSSCRRRRPGSRARVPAGSVVVRRMNFAGLAAFLAAEAPRGRGRDARGPRALVDADRRPGAGLHVQGRRPARHADEPDAGPAASDLLSTLDEAGLARLLAENADEPHAPRTRRRDPPRPRPAPLTTTRALAEVVRATYAAGPAEADADDAVRRVFQAIRIAVNDEFGASRRCSATSRLA